MTKAELLAAIRHAPDDAAVWIDDGRGTLRSQVFADADRVDGEWEIRIGFHTAPRDDE